MSTIKIPPKRMNLGVSDADLDAKLAAAREVAIQANIPTVTFPNDKPSAPTTPILPQGASVTTLPIQPDVTERKARGPKPSVVRRYSVDLPVYLIDEIHKRAFHSRRTKKLVILEALNAGGLKVKDIDLEAEKPSDES